MREFDNKAMSILRSAVFQNLPFLILAKGNDLTCAYRGNENELVDALVRALDRDPGLMHMFLRAIQHSQRTHLPETIHEIKTAV